MRNDIAFEKDDAVSQSGNAVSQYSDSDHVATHEHMTRQGLKCWNRFPEMIVSLCTECYSL